MKEILKPNVPIPRQSRPPPGDEATNAPHVRNSRYKRPGAKGGAGEASGEVAGAAGPVVKDLT